MLETLELFFDKGKIDKNRRNEFRMFLESTATDDEKRLRLISDLFEFNLFCDCRCFAWITMRI